MYMLKIKKKWSENGDVRIHSILLLASDRVTPSYARAQQLFTKLAQHERPFFAPTTTVAQTSFKPNSTPNSNNGSSS